MNAPIELYGERTGNCFRASIALEETNIPYRVNHVDFRTGRHRHPDFLAVNQAGRVPVIVDNAALGGPLILTQSLAILFYADEKAPGVLFPQERRARAVAMERFFFYVTDVLGPGLASFKTAAQDAQQQLVRTALSEWAEGERYLAASRYIAGDVFTAADIVAFTYILPHQQYLPWEDIPNLQRWFGEVGSRPTVQRGVAAFNPAGI